MKRGAAGCEAAAAAPGGRSDLSPCVGICRLHDETDYCLGCGRTGEEIAAWSTAGPGGRRAIWAVLPARLRSLGVGVRRLPWTAADIRGYVLRSLREGRGAWLLAALGASASFLCPAPAGCEIRSDGEVVEAIGAEAAVRLRCHAKAHAFALHDGTASGAAGGSSWRCKPAGRGRSTRMRGASLIRTATRFAQTTGRFRSTSLTPTRRERGGASGSCGERRPPRPELSPAPSASPAPAAMSSFRLRWTASRCRSRCSVWLGGAARAQPARELHPRSRLPAMSVTAGTGQNRLLQ